ncbi:MAG: CDP-diacylglycerol--serine O-phosphatidyltransferase [Candidatus Aenigmatarchaeota archaeon]
MALADAVTLIGLFFGIASIFLSLNGLFVYAAVAILFGLILDALDGYVARAMKRTGEFGVQLDSLSDAVVFGVAVAIFGYAIGLSSLLSMAILAFFVACGLLRLARFNITKNTTKGEYFEGLPIPANTVIPFLFLALRYFAINIEYMLVIYLISAMLMISGIRVKKI